MNASLQHIKVVIMCLVIAGLMAACQPQKGNPTETAQSKPALSATPNTDETRAKITNALFMLSTKSNRMTYTTVLQDGKTHPGEIEFVPPDRKRLAGEGPEYIIVGEKVFVKSAEKNTWEETQISAASFMGNGKDTLETIAKTIEDARLIRKDQLDGTAVFVYSYASTNRSNDLELHSQTELWVSEADGSPLKMIIDGEIVQVASDPATGESQSSAVKALTTTLITFDENIKIENPMQ
jgi:hypothetical protein